eukprot:TRINITY_DN7353_c0_g1_i3.p1 TRINITY_DN7353_c0_g1~~TRINITY_DN7353_c0_g1_i3.p1  ORF type:complete len:183 (-),score=31.50 TRINITY_DN7353_c0_g1_i3:31-579(-)
MIHVEYSQVMVVCISVLVLESVEFCLKKVTTFLQGLFGGKRYRRVMEIKDKIRELEKEKNEYHSVDQFPKIAKIERKIIQLELEDKEISLSYYITFGIPILLPIIYKALTYCIYISLIITYRHTPILSSEHLLSLPQIILLSLALPTGIEGGIGCVYVILTARMIFSHLLKRVVIRKHRKTE